jgi:aspartate/methionine/tyrosine aminotransferase
MASFAVRIQTLGTENAFKIGDDIARCEQAGIKVIKLNFEKRRDLVVDGLNQIEGIRCNKPDGAFYVFPNISGVCEKLGVLAVYEQLSEEEKQRTSPSTLFQMFALYRHGVATMDRRSFGSIGSEGKHYLRLSTATDMESLREGIRRIEMASKDIEGFRTYASSGKCFN